MGIGKKKNEKKEKREKRSFGKGALEKEALEKEDMGALELLLYSTNTNIIWNCLELFGIVTI